MKYTYFDTFSLSIMTIFLSLMFSHKKRKYFYILLPILLTAGFLLNNILSNYVYTGHDQLISLLRFGSCYLIWFLVMVALFKCKVSLTIFTCATGLAVEQFSSALKEIIFLNGSFVSLVKDFTLGQSLNTLIVNGVFYILFIVFYYKWILKFEKHVIVTSFLSHIIAIIIIFFCLGINRFIKISLHLEWNLRVAHALYAMLCSLLALFLQYGLVYVLNLKTQMHVISSMKKDDEQRLNEWKEMYEILDCKLHDMRHIISQANENTPYLKEMYDSVSSFEHKVKTGNQVLDILLYEKGISCERRKINFTHMANGKCLNSLEEIDIYSLFSNLLDNAIDAVSSLEEEKRSISLNLNSSGNMIAIHVSNYFNPKNMMMIDGLPFRIKQEENHGYGIKAIKQIVEKYHGKVSFTSEGQIFSTDIFLAPDSCNHFE